MLVDGAYTPTQALMVTRINVGWQVGGWGQGDVITGGYWTCWVWFVYRLVDLLNWIVE